jgi:chromosome segregation ATPase
VERARWSDERLDDRMSAIDTSFERVFEELRAERVEMRAERADLRAEMRAMRAELNERLTRLDERLSQLGFRAAGILAAGLIALVATQL